MQFVVVTEQVWQIVLQASQELVALLGMKVPVGQVAEQVAPAKKNPFAQVMQAVWVVQVAQGLTHAVQVVGLTAVSG